jgi:hypothetical protein
MAISRRQFLKRSRRRDGGQRSSGPSFFSNALVRSAMAADDR